MNIELFRRFLPVFFCAVLCLVAFSISATSLYILTISHWHGPFRDMWEIYPFIEKIINKTWAFSDLWESYGFSHRLVIPKLFFVADYQFFNASNHLLIFISTACQILICAIFGSAFFKEKLISGKTALCFSLVIISFQFSGSLLFNWMHTFDIQWFLSCLFVTAAFYFLSFSTTKLFINVELCHGASALCIAIACLNNFSAMAAWPIWAAMVLPDSRTRINNLFYIFAVVFFVAIFSQGINSGSVVRDGLIDSLKLWAYVFAIFPVFYLSNPLSDTNYFNFVSLISTAISIFFLFNFWINKLFIKNKEAGLEIFLASLGLFAYGVAVITAIGRGYDPAHVKAFRYQNIVLLFWSSALPLIWFQTSGLLRKYKTAVRFFPSCVFVAFVAYQPIAWNENIKLGYQVNRAHLALMMGFSNDVPMIAPTVSRSMIYVPGYNLERERALHEKTRKGIYHGEIAELWLEGITIEKIGQECKDVTWLVSPFVSQYARYISFTATDNSSESYKSAFLVDDVGKVVAIATPRGGESALSVFLEIHSNRSMAFRGFALPDAMPVALVLWGQDGYNGACKRLLP